MKKYLVWGGGLFFLIIIIVIIWQSKIIFRVYQTWQERQFLNKVENIKNAWRNDPVGGSTPEETLKMFITAFEAGDLGLASKYFVVDKQAEFLAKMQNWVRLGKKEEVISRLSQTKMYGDTESDFVSMEAQLSDSRIPYVVEIVKNKFTDKWKINNM